MFQLKKYRRAYYLIALLIVFSFIFLSNLSSRPQTDSSTKQPPFRPLLCNSLSGNCECLESIAENEVNKCNNEKSHREKVIDQLYGISSSHTKWPGYFKLLDKENLAPLTIEAQSWIYQKLHTPSATCVNQKYLILTGHRSGLGSIIHSSAPYLAWALENDYQIVWHETRDGAGSLYADSGCGRGEKVGNFLCYFEPPSGCGMEYVTPQNSVLQESFKIPVAIDFVPTHLVNMLNDTMLNTQISPAFVKFWWRAQSAAYLMKFNEATKQRLYRMRISKTFHNATQILSSGEKVHFDFPYPLPAKTFNAHIRHGDKHKEMTLLPLSSYVSKAEQLISENPFYFKKHIFVSTEDEAVIQEATSLKSILPETQPFLDWKVYLSNIHRINDSPYSQLDKFGKTDITHEWFLQLLMALECDVHLGTLASNWNRLIAELRCVWVDKCNFPYIEVGERSSWIDYEW